MTKWQWKVIISLIRVVLYLIGQLPLEPEELEEHTDVLHDAISREP